MSVELVEPDERLGRMLLPVARKIFTEAFAHLYEPQPFETFCDGTYSPGGPMDRDLRDPAVSWRVALSDGEAIAYAKLTPLRAPAPDPPPGSLELQQIYVLARWHGTGVAERLMRWAITTAGTRHAPAVYLTVFDHNERAKRFYARHGFQEVATCTFQLGDRVDDDRVWMKSLT